MTKKNKWDLLLGKIQPKGKIRKTDVTIAKNYLTGKRVKNH